MKLTNEKINTLLSIVIIVFGGVGWYSDKLSANAVENGVQSEQIKFFSSQLEELKQGQKEQGSDIKDLNKKVDSMMSSYYLTYKDKKNANI